MTLSRGAAVALALCALAAAGCGIGPGDDAGEVELTVTRDYGREAVIEQTEGITESDDVMRVLDRSAEVETRYGGRFVQSIDGTSSGTEGGRRRDWFFYVNGIESSVGATDFELGDGDRIWWDYRDWTAAMRVPAVVGSFPQPFLGGFQGERWPTRVECAGERSSCDQVEATLREQGAEVEAGAVGEPDPDAIRVLVGPYDELRGDPGADLLREPPSRSGVFATFGERPSSRWLLAALDAEGERRRRVGPAGLIAAVRPGEGPPTWLVTGTDEAGVRSATGALDEAELRGRYAVVATARGVFEVPVP